MLKTYLFLAPAHRNDGGSYEGARVAFEMHCVRTLGGITQAPIVQGQWYSEKSGRVMRDTTIPYYISCESSAIAGIMEHAFKLFPDQEALFVTELGGAYILSRLDYENVGRCTIPELQPLEAVVQGAGIQSDPRVARMITEAAEMLDAFGDYALGDL